MSTGCDCLPAQLLSRIWPAEIRQNNGQGPQPEICRQGRKQVFLPPFLPAARLRKVVASPTCAHQRSPVTFRLAPAIEEHRFMETESPSTVTFLYAGQRSRLSRTGLVGSQIAQTAACMLLSLSDCSRMSSHDKNATTVGDVIGGEVGRYKH